MKEYQKKYLEDFKSEYGDNKDDIFYIRDMESGYINHVGNEETFKDYISESFDEANDVSWEVHGYLDHKRIYKDYSLDFQKYTYDQMIEELSRENEEGEEDE